MQVLHTFRTNIRVFINSSKGYPVLTAIATGLYPIIYCYSKNYPLLNSVDHLIYFLIAYLCIPALVFYAIFKLFGFHSLRKYQPYILPFMGVFYVVTFILRYYQGGFQIKSLVLAFVTGLVFAYFLSKHLNKLIVLLFTMALLASFNLIGVVQTYANLPSEWKILPDDIATIEFKKKPNVYFIQPDGYTNSSEINSGYYSIDNSEFDTFLDQNQFTTYKNFRSNYTNTLSSNAAIFMMKHHYFYHSQESNEIYNAREMIISNNPVLDAFKANDYRTYFITESPYLLLNRPKMGFDACNIDYSDFSYVNAPINTSIDVVGPLSEFIDEPITNPKFFFIQILKPWHIHSRKGASKGAENEKNDYETNLKAANTILKQTILLIKKRDPNALILMMSDHGGYVGFDYTHQSKTKSEDRDLIHSIYSSVLAIHWPNNDIPVVDMKLKSSVNTFRILFSYLSENENYLNNLESDASYILFNNGVAQKGIYQYLDENGEVNIKSLEN